jgi:hypothetical protein
MQTFQSHVPWTWDYICVGNVTKADILLNTSFKIIEGKHETRPYAP